MKLAAIAAIAAYGLPAKWFAENLERTPGWNFKVPLQIASVIVSCHTKKVFLYTSCSLFEFSFKRNPLRVVNHFFIKKT